MSGKSAEFLDTNILIYAHDLDAGDRHWRAKEVVRRLRNSGAGKKRKWTTSSRSAATITAWSTEAATPYA